MSIGTRSLWAALLLGLLPLRPSEAGNGQFDPANRIFNFCVSIRFPASVTQHDKLASWFLGASGILYETTNGQHQFGTITAYNNKLAGKSADVWVLAGKGSSFASPGSFGVPGRTIVLYYDSLVKSDKMGVGGEYVIAHAFAHHAYGLFDEYHDGHGDPAECLSGPDTSSACLMENYKAAIAAGIEANRWCLASNHDADLDTAQNEYHNKSCWDAARARYSDLAIPTSADYVGPPFDLNNNKFKWVNGASTRRFVEIIDRSGSMGDASSPSSPMSLAKEAATLFIDLANPSDRGGVVAFGDTANKVWEISNMNKASKKAAAEAIATLEGGGSTSIGAGLQMALDMMVADGGAGCIQAMILLSDGYHNSCLSPSVVLPQIVANAIPVFTIGLGSSVDTELMQSIASSTGGRYFAALDASQLNGIFAQISAELKDGGVITTGANFLKSQELKTEKIVVDPKTDVATFIVSWDSINASLVFILDGPDDDSVSVDVKPPNALHPDPTISANPPPGIEVITGKTSVTVNVTESVDKVGTWKLTVSNKNTSASTAPVNYNYQVLTDDSDIVVSAAPDKLAYVANQVMTICANVLYDAPITNVDVRAEITRPDGSIFEAVLRDDGSLMSGDPFANDGNFACRFNGWNGNGIYQISVDVSGKSSAMTVQGESIDDKTADISVKTFVRHLDFSVSVTGATTVDTLYQFVDKAKLEYVSGNPLTNTAKIDGLFDLDPGFVDPEKQSLTIFVNNIAHTVDPANLVAIDDHRYVFDVDTTASSSTPNYFSGFVELFQKETSAGAYSLSSSGPPFALPAQGNPTIVRFRWGILDETSSVVPKVKPGSNGVTIANYNSKNHESNTSGFFVTSALVKRSKASNADKLSLRARFNSKYDPTGGTTTIRFGSYSRSISNWDTSPSNPEKLEFSSFDALSGATESIRVDKELREISVDGFALNLKDFPNPAVVELKCGSFSQKYEINLSTKKSSLKY